MLLAEAVRLRQRKVWAWLGWLGVDGGEQVGAAHDHFALGG